MKLHKYLINCLLLGCFLVNDVLVIRADASADIGIGHIMRSLALAQTWVSHGYQAYLLTGYDISSLKHYFDDAHIPIEYIKTEIASMDDACETINFCKKKGASWLLLDGYHFNEEYQSLITEQNIKLIIIDDYEHLDQYKADIIVNFSVENNDTKYLTAQPKTKLMMGPEYFVIRKSFNKWKCWEREINPIASKILLTMGGSDPLNITEKIIRKLLTLDISIDLKVVLGSNNLHKERIKCFLGTKQEVKLLTNISNMDELMVWADIGVTTGSTTALEMAYLGLPSIIFITTENQINIAKNLSKSGISINIGWPNKDNYSKLNLILNSLVSNYPKRLSMSTIGRTIIDGNGAEKIVRLLERY
jgi:UDP-2,4-diacetamido-2,4,6-trideoxy-beta-L-altropyranose hydrolase